MNYTAHILLAEDDETFGGILKSYLELKRFEVTWCKNGVEAYKKFSNNKNWNLCLLDVMMPQLDGFSLAREIRNIDKTVPILFITAKALKEDILKGYQCGADDYIIKPFDAEVLFYKINAMLSRFSGVLRQSENNLFSIGGYAFNYSTRSLVYNDILIQLSPKEADLLKYLCVYMNDSMPRDIALKNIWGQEDYFAGRSMDVYIAKLRKYLKNDSTIEIINIHGKGFMLTIRSIRV